MFKPSPSLAAARKLQSTSGNSIWKIKHYKTGHEATPDWLKRRHKLKLDAQARHAMMRQRTQSDDLAAVLAGLERMLDNLQDLLWWIFRQGDRVDTEDGARTGDRDGRVALAATFFKSSARPGAVVRPSASETDMQEAASSRRGRR